MAYRSFEVQQVSARMMGDRSSAGWMLDVALGQVASGNGGRCAEMFAAVAQVAFTNIRLSPASVSICGNATHRARSQRQVLQTLRVSFGGRRPFLS